MTSLRHSIVLASMMALVAVLGVLARPPAKDPSSAPRFLLEEIVPKQFGDWRELPEQNAQIVNPQTKALLDKLYSQILTRTYVNSRDYRIMLSMAYGDDQRGDLQAHKPEICYPAQGFTLHSNEPAPLATPFGAIETRRLSTSQGPRHEPVTYWFTVGDTVVKNKIQLRMIEIRLGLTGEVPDGVLVRVSSIDNTTGRAFAMQDAFVTDLLASLPAVDRIRLSGLRAGTTP